MSRNTPALRDDHKAVGSGVSVNDVVTTVMLRVDPVTDYLLVAAVYSGNSATYKKWNKRDDNYVPTMYGVSNADGVTLIPIRTDINGYLLTKSS